MFVDWSLSLTAALEFDYERFFCPLSFKIQLDECSTSLLYAVPNIKKTGITLPELVAINLFIRHKLDSLDYLLAVWLF